MMCKDETIQDARDFGFCELGERGNPESMKSESSYSMKNVTSPKSNELRHPRNDTIASIHYVGSSGGLEQVRFLSGR
jgi:hypothetical protein